LCAEKFLLGGLDLILQSQNLLLRFREPALRLARLMTRLGEAGETALLLVHPQTIETDTDQAGDQLDFCDLQFRFRRAKIARENFPFLRALPRIGKDRAALALRRVQRAVRQQRMPQRRHETFRSRIFTVASLRRTGDDE